MWLLVQPISFPTNRDVCRSTKIDHITVCTVHKHKFKNHCCKGSSINVYHFSSTSGWHMLMFSCIFTNILLLKSLRMKSPHLQLIASCAQIIYQCTFFVPCQIIKPSYHMLLCSFCFLFICCIWDLLPACFRLHLFIGLLIFASSSSSLVLTLIRLIIL